MKTQNTMSENEIGNQKAAPEVLAKGGELLADQQRENGREPVSEGNDIGDETPSSPPPSPPSSFAEAVVVGKEEREKISPGAFMGSKTEKSFREAAADGKVNGKELLDELVETLRRYVILPQGAAETLALWTLHTHAFQLRDVTTYIGLESPEKRCGKTTLLTVLSELVSRPVVAANISSPAFFRVIEETRPTLLIDESDTFLQGSDELGGILNAGYKKKTAFVWRVTNEVAGGGWRGTRKAGSADGVTREPERNFKLQTPSSKETPSINDREKVVMEKVGDGRLSYEGGEGADIRGSRVAKFSCWCPKVICAIGRLPETLADRCIVIRMERKREDEECERFRDFDGGALREGCERFVREHENEIRAARPRFLVDLNDRAAEIWEPLLALAELAGGPWPESACRAASHLTSRGEESNPIGSLLMDIFMVFARKCAASVEDARAAWGDQRAEEVSKALGASGERLFSRELVAGLQWAEGRPWRELLRGREVTELWLAQRLRPYGIRPRMMRRDGEQSRGYHERDFLETFRRYIPKSEVEELRERIAARLNGEGVQKE